jgi:hypothetical protein
MEGMLLTTYVIMRVFCKTDIYCQQVIEKIRQLLLAGVGRIIVLVSNSLDKVNSDEKIRKAFSGEKVSVFLLEKEFKSPSSWSRALNAGIKILKEFNPSDQDTLLIVSNEVSMTSDVLGRMKEAISSGAEVVGLIFPGFNAKSYLSFPRNTAALWLWSIAKHGFSTLCDKIGGMEDYCLIRRKRLKYIMIEPGIALGIVSGTNQTAKEQRELRAMRIIDWLQRFRVFDVVEIFRVFDR